MESQMSTQVMSSGPTRFPSRAKFVLVNDRVPRTDAYCALRVRTGGKVGRGRAPGSSQLACEPIEQGYVRETQTRLLYCDVQCFAGHEKLAMLSLEKRARQVS